MAILTKNQHIAPFWGAQMSFVAGLDPLSLQTTSEATYTLLLSGLNNVTDSLRYYGFYCWLFQQYFSGDVKKKYDKQSQRQFFRRAEFIVAIITQQEAIDATGVSGRDKAKKIIDEEPDIYDIADGADQKVSGEEGTYWKNAEGIFGQYYKGAMRDIGLIIEPEDRIYNVTSTNSDLLVSGEALAEGFGENIHKRQREIFLQAVYSGKLKASDTPKLFEYFNLTLIPFPSPEHELYGKLLIDIDRPLLAEDEPVRFRSRTIEQILKFAEETKGFEPPEFPLLSYTEQGKIKGVLDDCLYGWYYYQLNEYWQFLCLTMLHGSMRQLEQEGGNHGTPFHRFMQIISDKVISELQKQKIIKHSTDAVKQVIGKMSNADEEEVWRIAIEESLDSKKFIQAIAFAFTLLFKLANGNQTELESLKSYASESNHGNERDGDFVTFALHMMQQNSDQSITDFVKEFLYKRIIYRHHHIAFHKMGNGTLSTQKFLIEDGNIRVLGNFYPGFSSPRLRNLCGFMNALGWLNKNNSITKEGMKILKLLTK